MFFNGRTAVASNKIVKMERHQAKLPGLNPVTCLDFCMRKDTIKIEEKQGRDLSRKAENYASIAWQANLFVFGPFTRI